MEHIHSIKLIQPGSIAEELELEPGDCLIAINEQPVLDVFDYHYMIHDEKIVLLIQKPDGEEWELEIEKDYDEDLGIEFEQPLMDEYRSCRNRCIFCFIDQMPPGMRETLYFKDDDARLSFLQGNYITLTNMKDENLDRIIHYHLAPINISVHTTNPELRCKMLSNRFAGEALKKIDRLYEAGIEMNSQIVLCKGYNDGEELDRTICDLMKYQPHMRSLSVVPMGMTKYRENLVQVEPFYKEDAKRVLEQIHHFQKLCLEQFKTRFVYASDEWYILAGLPIPDTEYYEGFGQLENGVGMIRTFLDEVEEALEDDYEVPQTFKSATIVTGTLFAPYLEQALAKARKRFPMLEVEVIPIVNDFFGHGITVTGLLTGVDIIAQLRERDLKQRILLPSSVLRSGEEVLLDDITVTDIEKALQKPVDIVESNGKSWLKMLCMRNGE